MRRREFIGVIGIATVWPLAAHAQQAGQMRRIGVLMSDNHYSQAWFAAFRGTLEKLGWIEGRNLIVEYRWGDNADLQRARAQELATLKLDLVLAGAASSLTRVKEAIHATPIVFANVPDPVSMGFVPSLTRPGGNITGFASYEQTVGAKWLELLKQIAPSITRVAFIYDPSNPATSGYLRAAEAAAVSFGVNVLPAQVHTPEEMERVVGAFAGEPNGGVIFPPSPLMSTHRALIINLTARHKLPAIFPWGDAVKDGALASYGIDPIDLFRRAASYADRILKGEKPGELPVQFATKFELMINLKTARTLGLDVPISLLARTDEVIE